MGSSSRPGLHVTSVKRDAAFRVLQQHKLDVMFSHAGGGEGTDQEDVRVGAAGHSDALALQVLDSVDRAVGLGDQRGPFRAGVDVDRADRVAIDTGDQGSCASGGSEIDGAGVEELQRLVRPLRLDPADLNLIRRERLLERALLFEDEADRIVGRPVDGDRIGLVLQLRIG